MTRPRVHLEHCIERWDASTAAEQVARVGDFLLALATYQAASSAREYGVARAMDAARQFCCSGADTALKAVIEKHPAHRSNGLAPS
jgi:hypothetical protein